MLCFERRRDEQRGGENGTSDVARHGADIAQLHYRPRTQQGFVLPDLRARIVVSHSFSRRCARVVATLLGLLAPAVGAGAQLPTPAAYDAWPEYVNGSEWDRYLRALAVRDTARADGWTVRTFAPHETAARARMMPAAHPWAMRLGAAASSPRLTLLRPSLSATYNSGFAWGTNDGAVWQGRGATTWATAGATARWRGTYGRLAPVVAWTSNGGYALRPPAGPDPYGATVTGIDLPQRFGDAPRGTIDPGESFVGVAIGPFDAALSTAHVGWGPGIAHPMLLGTNAAGFPHLRIGTSRPIGTPIGRFATQLLYARLAQSDFAEPSRFSSRRGAGIIVGWQPTRDLEVGVARFYLRPATGPFGLDDLTAPFGSTFYNPDTTNEIVVDNQMASVFARARLPRAGMEIFGEFVKNDRAKDFRDLALEPEHNGAWLLGVLHATRPDPTAGFWATRLEIVNARPSRIQALGRGQALLYAHSRLVQGHTQRGQLLGTPLAEQSGGAEFAVDRWTRRGRMGVAIVERQLPDDTGLGMAPGAERSQWDFGADVTLFVGRADVRLQTGYVHDFNRLPGKDAGNLYVRVGWRAALP